MRELAQQRAAHYRATHGRPSQRRNAEAANYRSPEGFAVGLQAARAKIELRDQPSGDETAPIPFTGYACITGKPYEMYDMFGAYTEIVQAGAFEETLAKAGLDVPLVIQHSQAMRLARTTLNDLRLQEDGLGLRVDADLDPTNHWVRIYEPQIRSGLYDEMSFAFRIVSGSWSEDWETYTIESVDIDRGDVAIVGFGANPFTDAGVRAESSAETDNERAAADAPAAAKTRRSIPREFLNDVVI